MLDHALWAQGCSMIREERIFQAKALYMSVLGNGPVDGGHMGICLVGVESTKGSKDSSDSDVGRRTRQGLAMTGNGFDGSGTAGASIDCPMAVGLPFRDQVVRWDASTLGRWAGRPGVPMVHAGAMARDNIACRHGMAWHGAGRELNRQTVLHG